MKGAKAVKACIREGTHVAGGRTTTESLPDGRIRLCRRCKRCDSVIMLITSASPEEDAKPKYGSGVVGTV